MQEVHTQQLYDQVTQNADVLSVIFKNLAQNADVLSLYVARKVCKEWRAVASEEVQRLRQTVQLTDAHVFNDWCAGASLPAKIRAAANLRTQELVRLRAKHDFVDSALVPNGWSKVKVKAESMRYASSASTTTASTSTTSATSNATSTGTTTTHRCEL